MDSSKKFRFDSFATEFACKDVEEMADSDSGIDSEETQISPPSGLFLHQTCEDQPLSLVLREQNCISDRRSKPSTAKRHWKKFLKDQASIKTEEMEQQQNEAENLCIHDLYNKSAESSVAQALLSLGRTDMLPQMPRNLPIPVAPERREMTVLHQQPLPFRSLQQNSPWSSPENRRPENFLNIKLPQHPTPVRTFPSTNMFAPINQTNNILFSVPFREIQSNHQHQSTANETQPPTSFFMPTQSLFSPSSSENRESSPATSPASSTTTESKSSSKSSRKPFFCFECKKGFSTQSGYIKHQQMHSTNQIQKNFSCKFCNKGYTSLSALKMHIRTHTLPCKCDICGKSFSRPWLLQGHVRIHTGEKPFSCNYCTRSFADKSNLRAHLQTHLQTKKYSCPGCQKTFSRMSLLNKHTDSGCTGLQSRNKECVQTLLGLSGSLIRT